MLRKLIPILLAVGSCRAAPASTYDQRQDGDVNVKVDLDNFVILIARPISALDVFGSMSQLLADSKSSSQAIAQAEIKEQESEAKSVVEDELIKLEKLKDIEDEVSAPEASQPVTAEEPVIQEKTVVAVVQEGEKAARSLEDIAKSLRSLKAKEGGGGAKSQEKEKVKSITGKYKFVESVDDPQSLKLIGDAIENCGPGRSRDRSGICQEDISQ